MSKPTSLDHFEQGKLILQDIEEEAIRQLEFFEIPRRVLLDTNSYKALMLHVKPEDVDGNTLFILGKYDLELVIFHSKTEFLLVTGNNVEEYEKLQKSLCKK